jgi:hypothetical protein
MRRFIVMCVAAGVLAAMVVGAPASFAGGHPETETFSDSFSDSAKAGELCDFRYANHATLVGTARVFTDAHGEPIREMAHVVATITHINVDTGATLTERLVENSRDDFVAGTGSTVGLQWHLKSPSGGAVLTVSGRLTYSFDPFEIISITPRVDRYIDFPGTICPALGGAPAN